MYDDWCGSKSTAFRSVYSFVIKISFDYITADLSLCVAYIDWHLTYAHKLQEGVHLNSR